MFILDRLYAIISMIPFNTRYWGETAFCHLYERLLPYYNNKGGMIFDWIVAALKDAAIFPGIPWQSQTPTTLLYT
jgi:hypothetical protein